MVDLKDYQRLTGRYEGKCTDINSSAPINDVLERLAYFEDAVERGELVGLPCAIGTTVYVVEYDGRKKRYVLNEEIVERFIVYNHVTTVYVGTTKCLHMWNFNESWFLDKALAEAKLTEKEMAK